MKSKFINKREDVYQDAERIISLYRDELMSTSEIGKIYHCSSHPIKSILRWNDVMMTKSERRNKLIESGKLVIWNKEKECPQLKGENNGFYSKKHSEETKELMRKPKTLTEKRLDYLKELELNRVAYTKVCPVCKKEFSRRKNNRIYCSNNCSAKAKVIMMKTLNRITSIEVKIQDFLRLLHIEFIAHYYTKEISHAYQCDMFIPVQSGILQKTIIECDGDYFHGNPTKCKKIVEWQIKQKELDEIRNKELEKQGFRVIRLWENEIHSMNLNKFQEILR